MCSLLACDLGLYMNAKEKKILNINLRERYDDGFYLSLFLAVCINEVKIYYRNEVSARAFVYY